jgi:precorrin-3B C17-methyltransferase
MRYRDGKTPVGIVGSAMREDETVTLTDLETMLDADIHMQSTVIIGNSTTFAWHGQMITPRGYKDKYTLES